MIEWDELSDQDSAIDKRISIEDNALVEQPENLQ